MRSVSDTNKMMSLERFVMRKLLKIFTTKDDGAVTVDWIVMCAAIVMLSVSAIGAAQSSVDNLAKALSGEVSKKDVVKLGD